MSYQGDPGYGGGYSGQYGQEGAYRSQQSQNGGYMQQSIPQSPGAYPPGNLSQQQFMTMQAHNQQVFYQNNQQQLPPISQPVQYNQSPYATAQPQYFQSHTIFPPQHSYQQPQYAHPRQQSQYTPSRPAHHSQYDGSSDGHVNPFRQSQPQQQQLPNPTPQPVAQSGNTMPIPLIVKQQAPSQSKMLLKPFDPYTLLPPLAEEYFGAAHSMALGTARQADPEALERYQKLIATGLGCLEAALNEGRLEPRMEAKIRLRYAGVLMEETVNMMEAETALSKGITLCEQNRFFDIKYSMQTLLAKLLFRKSPKAALISLDNIIEEVEAYQHHSWIYIFRFLRATLSLQTGRSTDFHAAVANFHAISDIAQRRSDYAVVTFASLMEALAYLRTPGPDSVENLNRALAAAQTYQLSPECNISPLKVFSHMLGVTTSLMDDTSEKTFEKLKAFQLLLNESSKDKTWKTHSDIISIPLNRNNGDAQIISTDTRGLLNISEDGREMLVFSFISKQDAYLIGYLLAGVARIHVKGDDVTPMKYLRDGLANALDVKPSTKQKEHIGSLSIFQDALLKRRTTACYFYAFIAFRAIFTTEWAAAKDALAGLEEILGGIDHDSEPTLAQLSIYLSAMYFQGTGDIDQALKLYADESLALPDPANPPQTPDAQVCRDIAVVAAMNTLLILNSRPNPNVESNTALLRRLDAFCPTHPNSDIQTAYYIVRTVVTTNPPTSQLAIKAYMRQALTGAKKRGNFHLVCITLNVMCTRFFANIIGEQSIKSAMAAKEQSMKSGNKLWMSAATGLLARSQDIEGRGQEAAETMADAARFADVALQTSS